MNFQEKYRKDYPGEFVVTKTSIKNGKKEQEREWIENPLENNHISGRAVVIGNGDSKNGFRYPMLQSHRGGLLGKKKLQTYITGDDYKKMKADFYITNERPVLERVIASDYHIENVVYTNVQNCIKYPGLFYLVPYNPIMENTVTAAYVAAFDEHKEIFLLGFDQNTAEPNTEETNQINKLIRAYSSTQWYFVTDWPSVPIQTLRLPNVKKMSYREFVSYCDV